MRQDRAGIECDLVKRDRLNQTLEGTQRRAGAAIAHAQRLIIRAGADEGVQQLGRIGRGVICCRRSPVRRRRRRIRRIALGLRVDPRD